MRLLCEQYQVPLIINDSIELCIEVDADGVHLGKQDSSFEKARDQLSTDKIIGITCHDSIGAAVSASEGVDLLCYLTPSEHLALPNAEEVKAGLIAYRIAAHAGDLVKLRDKAIKWDMKMTEARRTLDWEKQLALSIDPELAAKLHGRTGQHPGNNMPCTMCGGACV